LLRRVRALVGPEVPIGCTLDLHANVSPAMVTYADIVVDALKIVRAEDKAKGRPKPMIVVGERA
jgi:hypothetical protein